MLLDEFVALGALEVFLHHFRDEFLETGLGGPTQLLFGFSWVAQEGFDFGGTKVTRINLNDSFAVDVKAFFIDALAFPGNGDVEFFGGSVNKITDAVLHTGGNDEVFWMVLLEHEPLHFDVILSMTPVAQCVEVA